MPSSADRLHDAIAHGPMSPLQVTTVVICLAINLIDGFDVLAISFTASTLAAEWQLQDDQLGLLISAKGSGDKVPSEIRSSSDSQQTLNTRPDGQCHPEHYPPSHTRPHENA